MGNVERREVRIPLARVTLDGMLEGPLAPVGVVIFAHGSGSSRFSSRNRLVADALHDAGLATLMFDLLAPSEAGDRTKVFDIPLLASRLIGVSWWVQDQPETSSLPQGLFGASTGAAAALVAAAELGDTVKAVVSRGGRPDLADAFLQRVIAPVLLIVGEEDRQVMTLNRQTLTRLGGTAQLHTIPGATHLFEEPGTLEQVAGQASDWFARHLSQAEARLAR